MTVPPPNDWLEHGQNAVWFFGAAFAGFCVFLFGRPIQHERRMGYANRGGKQKRKRKPKQKRVVKQSLTTQKKSKKANKQKQRPRYVAPPMSPEQHARVAKYYAERDGKKSDEWAGYGGIPL